MELVSTTYEPNIFRNPNGDLVVKAGTPIYEQILADNNGLVPDKIHAKVGRKHIYVPVHETYLSSDQVHSVDEIRAASAKYLEDLKTNVPSHELIKGMYQLATALKAGNYQPLRFIDLEKVDNEDYSKELAKIHPELLEVFTHTIIELQKAANKNQDLKSLNFNQLLMPYEDKLKNLKNELEATGATEDKKILYDFNTKGETFIRKNLTDKFEPSLFLHILNDPDYAITDKHFLPQTIKIHSKESSPSKIVEDPNISFVKLDDFNSSILKSNGYAMTLGNDLSKLPSTDFLMFATESTRNALKRYKAEGNGNKEVEPSFSKVLQETKIVTHTNNLKHQINVKDKSNTITSASLYAHPHFLVRQNGEIKPRIKRLALNERQIGIMTKVFHYDPNYYDKLLQGVNRELTKSIDGFIDEQNISHLVETYYRDDGYDNIIPGIFLAPVIKQSLKEMQSRVESDPDRAFEDSNTIDNSKTIRRYEHYNTEKPFHKIAMGVMYIFDNNRPVSNSEVIPFVFKNDSKKII
ncbi:MAG: hypothetical protein MK033_01975 [Candidatus Caenarcaniphilales bacterium]|nr:hypothetical protein [Candidatus Caenarcaniphilales bacterium]